MFHRSSFSPKSFTPKSWKLNIVIVVPVQPDFGAGGWAPKRKRVSREETPPGAYNLTRLHAEDQEIVELLMVLVTEGFMDGYG